MSINKLTEKELDDFILEQLEEIQSEANRLLTIQKVSEFWQAHFKKYQEKGSPS